MVFIECGAQSMPCAKGTNPAGSKVPLRELQSVMVHASTHLRRQSWSHPRSVVASMTNHGLSLENPVRSTGVALPVGDGPQGSTSYSHERTRLAVSACTHCGSRVACNVRDSA